MLITRYKNNFQHFYKARYIRVHAITHRFPCNMLRNKHLCGVGRSRSRIVDWLYVWEYH